MATHAPGTCSGTPLRRCGGGACGVWSSNADGGCPHELNSSAAANGCGCEGRQNLRDPRAEHVERVRQASSAQPDPRWWSLPTTLQPGARAVPRSLAFPGERASSQRPRFSRIGANAGVTLVRTPAHGDRLCWKRLERPAPGCEGSWVRACLRSARDSQRMGNELRAGEPRPAVRLAELASRGRPCGLLRDEVFWPCCPVRSPGETSALGLAASELYLRVSIGRAQCDRREKAGGGSAGR